MCVVSVLTTRKLAFSDKTPMKMKCRMCVTIEKNRDMEGRVEREREKEGERRREGGRWMGEQPDKTSTAWVDVPMHMLV